jgi:5-methylcytosine-specific restriction protein B
MDNKEQFKSWVLSNMGKNSNAGLAYITSLDWLSKRFFEKGKIGKESIFEIQDVDLIQELYSEAIKNQKDKSSYIYKQNAPSYGDNNYFSASLNKYKEFLLAKRGNTKSGVSKKVLKVNSGTLNINDFIESVSQSGLVFSDTLINRFVASLLTKPFVLLTGLSGSGKTKIAQSFARWISEDKSQYKIIPVGSDWTNREPLLGYPNGLDTDEYILPDSGALRLIIEASKEENQRKPYFLILDEMNLSHVERYFADFLSVMESDEEIMLYSGKQRKSSDGIEVPGKISWSQNLFVIGTVNIDETTYMFSPKVLDRANTIEFRIDDNHIKNFLEQPLKIDLSVLDGKGASMAHHFLAWAKDNQIEQDKIYTETFVKFFNELKKIGAEFGYRTAIEMLLLIKKLNTVGEFTKEQCIDIALMQKLLPKLHGSRSKISKVLDALISLCLKEGVSFTIAKSDEIKPEEILYPITFEKLVRMYRNALDNGFTSYAEA